MIKPQTLKGFRDFLPRETKKRQYVINTLKAVFELYGLEPLETPALEYENVLLGKYGEEGDKLMYRFKDLGGRKVALRYDQTVPLARVVAQYQNQLPMPFKRYQIQPVWRGENPQKGRFREFLQVDADIVGSSSPLADAETIVVATKVLEELGFSDYKIFINDRIIFEGLPKQLITSIDKLKKIGKEDVAKELVDKGVVKTADEATLLLDSIIVNKPTERLSKIFSYLETFLVKKSQFEFSPTLARGLDYYTSTIFEIEIEGYSAGSVCGGGRYDNLIGIFAGKQIPAVGFSFGFDRLIEAIEKLNLFQQSVSESSTKVLVTVFNPDLLNKSLEVTTLLHGMRIDSELYLNENTPLEKQLKYADKRGIPFAVIIGPEEALRNEVTLRNLKTRQQKTVSVKNLADELL